MVLTTNKKLNKFVKNNPFWVFLLGTLFSGLGVAIVTSINIGNEKNFPENLSISALQEQGENEYKKKNYDKAIESFEKLLTKNPKNTDALKYLSLCYESTNRRKSAVIAIDNAISLDSKNVKLYETKCGIYKSKNLQEEDYKQGIIACNKALPLISRKDEVLDSLSFYHLNIHEYELALKFRNIRLDKKTNISLSKEYLGYDYYKRGDIYRAMKKYKLAIADYKKSLELSPASGLYYKAAKIRINNIEKNKLHLEQ